PGAEACQSGVAHECDAQGNWSSLDTCSGAQVNCGGCDLGESCESASDCTSNVCLSDTCVACSPGARACTGSVPRQCSAQGSWTNQTACPAPANGTATCSAGNCGFTCHGGFKACQAGCIATSACCTSADCQANASCNASNACVCDAGLSGPNCTCGNGSIDAGEACDDSNTAAGDGCSSSCQVEATFTCAGSPSLCNRSCLGMVGNECR